MVVRPETARDHRAVADINDQAFGGTDESRIIEALRQSGRPLISLVAATESALIGHILFSPVEIDVPGPKVAALGLGPMSVLPQFQRQGIGSRLVEAGLEECSRRACEVVVVLGHPHFYQRFGFKLAPALGLRSEYPDAGDAFMAMELVKCVLAGRSVGHGPAEAGHSDRWGLVTYCPEFASV